ncbi:hypothetical protein HLH26_15790 [Gluconacetobacter sp. 1b LMG 1731]|uniref:Uncharacterized protein n=1 Tax=Gluconacetobacter dulcium TaxID=2729096 RepID=A0A7W4IN31_9PROT|nr:hypothetical protein [Gluconacetobacter dulcium]MBB2165965.1 hypothetical protein [Gluconacetobacter dulcium]MBB2195102.1 hypothetical protein [Gluconacetobacter dulcium]
MPTTPQTITVTLGSSYVDRVTGFSGIATARTEYLTGRSRVELSPSLRPDGRLPRPEWFDEERLDRAQPCNLGGRPKKDETSQEASERRARERAIQA